MLQVTEIFLSIQGESSHAGLPFTFIRLTGCPLRCTWCDTDYAFYGGREYTLDAIIRDVELNDCPRVLITGGEPLAQKNVYPLMERLLDLNHQVFLETSGALSTQAVPAKVVKIVDFKCPGSGESAKNDFSNIECLDKKDEVKFVILDRKDYEWSKEIVLEKRIAERAQVLFSPVMDKLSLENLADWILEDKLPVRLQTQLHKWIWGKDAKGV